MEQGIMRINGNGKNINKRSGENSQKSFTHSWNLEGGDLEPR